MDVPDSTLNSQLSKLKKSSAEPAVSPIQRRFYVCFSRSNLFPQRPSWSRISVATLEPPPDEEMPRAQSA